MPDSISVIGPGFRATDNNGAIITDGILAFFAAGTTTPLTVYSDSGLTTSLGTTVTCNSAGYPVTSANAKTLVYTGTAAYKIRLTSVLFGGTVFEFDNVKAALNTASFLTSAAVADKTIVATSVNRAITVADKGKLINVNCTSAALTMTLDSASVLGSGFFVGVRHDGTANQVKITGNGTDAFGVGSASTTGLSLTGRGQVVWIACDGTGFKIDAEVPPLIAGNAGVIIIADRLSTPPGSPTAGARYIVTASPLGAWSTFAQHDIAEATGQGTWFKYTPATNIGWMAYVQDESRYYSLVGSAWVESAVSIGSLTAATGLADSDLVRVERAGVNFKVTRANGLGWRYITSGSVSAAATQDLTIPADCDVMEIELWNWRPATDNTLLYMRFSQSAAFLAGASDYTWGHTYAATAALDLADPTLVLATGWSNNAGIGSHITVRIFKPNTAGETKTASWVGGYTFASGDNYVSLNGAGNLALNTNAIDGVRFLYSAGNITSGFYAVKAFKYT
jgi:hypothetical protein